MRAHVSVKAILVHAEVRWGISKSQEPGCNRVSIGGNENGLLGSQVRFSHAAESDVDSCGVASVALTSYAPLKQRTARQNQLIDIGE